MKHKPFFGRFALVALALAAVALLALACEDEEEAATPTPAVTPGTPVATPGTPAATPGTPTPTALKPGAAGIASNPRQVKGLEGLLTLDDGLAIFKQRPASEDRTGVTATTIKLGRHTGITGFVAPYEPAWGGVIDALIKRVNDAGGIHGRTLQIVTKDDQSGSSSAVAPMRELVEGEKVFALFFPVGSPAHSAVHDYHVQQKVPYLFYLDAANTGQEPVTSKWDVNGQNSDIQGGIALVEAVYRQDPNAKIALVYADFPASVAARDGIKYQAEKRGLEIVATFAHDLAQVDLTSVAQQVGATDATWLVYHGSLTHMASLAKALKETVGWKGKIAQWGWVPGDPTQEKLFDGATMVSPQASPQGEPDLPIWPKLEALAKEEGKVYISSLAGLAYNEFEHLVRALELAGPDLTREGLIEAIDNGFTAQDNFKCDTCRGVTILGPQDHWTNETWSLQLWNATTRQFDKIGAGFSQETSEGLGLRGNFPGLECKPASADLPKGSCPWKQS